MDVRGKWGNTWCYWLARRRAIAALDRMRNGGT